MKVILNVQQENGDYEHIQVFSLEDLFLEAKALDPSIYAFVEFEADNEYLSMEVMP